MITKENVIYVFEDLKNNEIDINKELLWGFFFLDSNLRKLIRLSIKLQELEYRLVAIFKIEKEHEKDVKEYCLHVEKIEIHNIDSLCARNQEFYVFVANNEISYYDGFDVGKNNS